MVIEDRKNRIHKEKEKIRQVTHWDLDYLSSDEILALYESKRQGAFQGVDDNQISRHNKDYLALLLIATGVVLLFGSLFMASLV